MRLEQPAEWRRGGIPVLPVSLEHRHRPPDDSHGRLQRQDLGRQELMQQSQLIHHVAADRREEFLRGKPEALVVTLLGHWHFRSPHGSGEGGTPGTFQAQARTARSGLTRVERA